MSDIARAVVLDDEQRRAADLGAGVLKLIGGPGTGKTTVLRERVARLVEGGVDPAAVLVFGRDRRSSIAARDAIVRRLGRSVAGPSVLTFHAFAWSLLTRGFPVAAPEGGSAALGFELAGYAAEPLLLTAFDQRAFVATLLAREDPDDWPVNAALLRSDAFAGEVRDLLLRAQEMLLTPTDVARLAARRGRPDWAEVAAFYGRYLAAVQDPDGFADGRPRLDFAMVLAEARRVLGEHERVAEDLRTLYPHILVDDFEEANRAEAALLDTLLPEPGDGRSAVVAGDPQGSVYAFRGADPTRLAALAAPVVELRTQYRRAAPPQVRLYSHVTEEARAAVAELRAAAAGGAAWGDLAVIVRDLGPLLAPLRRELTRAGVPHRVDGESIRLAHDPVVRPVLDLFTVACRRPGHEELWPELLTSELGGLSLGELVELRRAARLADRPLHEVCSERLHGGLGEALAAKLDALCDLVDEARAWISGCPPDEAFWRLWQRAPWFDELVAADDDRRLDSLTTLADALARFTDRRGRQVRMGEFIETLRSAEFAPESIRLDGPQDAVSIATSHGAKGREFELAVVAGCVEGMWPDPSRRGLLLDVDLLARDRAPAARLREALEEEERLFRLATSRARRVVASGLRAGGSERLSAQPSRFLDRLGPLPEGNDAVPDLVLTAREAELAWRRSLHDPVAPPARRLAALWALGSMPAADPERWWWGRTWTDGRGPVVPEPKKTSYSRFADFDNCPLAYLLGQVLGLDPERTYQMAYGSLIHGLLEDAEAGRLPREVPALVEEARRRWRDEDYPPGAVAGSLWRDCVEIIERYVALEANNKHRTLATEKWFEFPVDGWTVRGKIDRIDALEGSGIRLIDYKTSNRYKTDDEVKDDLQLATYFLACQRDEELSKLGVAKCAELLFLRHTKSNGIRRATQLPKRAEDGTPWEVATERRIVDMLGRIDKEEFGPSPEADCRFCKFKTLCPMWPEGEELRAR
jgi:superfamily I DNA/RNA helicase/RecB family exonuclease